MQIQSYQNKMLDYVEKYSTEDLNWKQSEIEASTYERFFETSEPVTQGGGDRSRMALWLINALVYLVLFRFFFGLESMVALILPAIPLGIVAILVYIFRIH